MGAVGAMDVADAEGRETAAREPSVAACEVAW